MATYSLQSCSLWHDKLILASFLLHSLNDAVAKHGLGNWVSILEDEAYQTIVSCLANIHAFQLFALSQPLLVLFWFGNCFVESLRSEQIHHSPNTNIIISIHDLLTCVSFITAAYGSHKCESQGQVSKHDEREVSTVKWTALIQHHVDPPTVACTKQGRQELIRSVFSCRALSRDGRHDSLYQFNPRNIVRELEEIWI